MGEKACDRAQTSRPWGEVHDLRPRGTPTWSGSSHTTTQLPDLAGDCACLPVYAFGTVLP